MIFGLNEADPERLKDHASGSLIGTFVGDALGMPVEGWSAERIKQHYGEVDEMQDARLGTGTYTDDTQMMIALARSMVRSEGIDRQVLARSFLDHYDSNRGYGRGTRRVMNLWEQGVDPAEASNRIFDGGSFGNGASMRTAPLGIVYGPEPDRLNEVIDDAAGVTHAHPRGRAGAYLQSRAVGEAFQRGVEGKNIEPANFAGSVIGSLPDRFRERNGYWTKRYESIRDLLNEGTPVDPATAAGTLGCSSVSGKSVPTALYAFLTNWNQFDETCTYAVGIGGDTDTIAAMAGAIAGAYHGLEAVPDRWFENLETGEDGRDTVDELGRSLVETFFYPSD